MPASYLLYGVSVMLPVTPRGISNFKGDVTFLADRARRTVRVPRHVSFHPTSSPTLVRNTLYSFFQVILRRLNFICRCFVSDALAS
jgi:hypothetical protein